MSTKKYKIHLKELISFLGPRVPLYLIISVFVGVSLSMVELGFAFALQNFLAAIGVMNAVSVRLPFHLSFQDLNTAVVIVFGFGLLRAIFNGLQSYISILAFESQKLHQQGSLVHWALKSPTASSSEMMLRFNEETGSVSSVIGNGLSAMTTFTTAFFCWLGLLRFAFVPTLLATGFLFLMGLALMGLDRYVKGLGTSLAREAKEIHIRILRNIRNLLLVQVYHTQDLENNIIQKSLRSCRDYILRFQRVLALKNFMPQVLGIVLLCVLTLYIKKSALLAPSLLISYFYLFFRFVQNSTESLRSVTQIRFLWPHFINLYTWWVDRGHKDLQIFDQKRLVSQQQKVKPLAESIGWTLKDVTFVYPNTEKEVLSHVNFNIQPKHFTVITGSSGAGKSTLLRLLLGLYEPTSGTVQVNALDGSHLTLEGPESLLKSVGYVDPESFMIDGTILENLTYGQDRPVTTKEVKEALNLAEADFVDQLPLGLEHRLTEQGQGLSAGQKQRLSLARALLRNPKILILDEATSNLDYQTEERLIQTFVRLKKFMTVVFVTHRPTVLPFADKHIQLN